MQLKDTKVERAESAVWRKKRRGAKQDAKRRVVIEILRKAGDYICTHERNVLAFSGLANGADPSRCM